MYRDYHVQGAVVQTVQQALKDMGVEGFTVVPRNQPTIIAIRSNLLTKKT